MSRYPLVTWAQRLDKLFITIELADAKNVKLYLDAEGKLFFSANSGAENTPYMIDIDLYDKVDINESRARYTPRKILYVVKKAESKWWCRLLIQEGKPPVFLKVDWDKWVDVDEDDEISGGDMDFLENLTWKLQMRMKVLIHCKLESVASSLYLRYVTDDERLVLMVDLPQLLQ